ncbi:MAG: thermonuclease family protein [Novosphingobium sp.]|nr:thermonuclease family protein [Novosphingobium sp.]
MRSNVIHFPRRKHRVWHQFAFVIVAGVGLGWIAHIALDRPNTATPVASACIANVHDGDTIRTCDGERIRISNIEAPEMRGSPKCRRGGWCDYALAEQSRDELSAFLASGTVTIARSGTDKYDRTLATVAVNGQDAGEHLIARSLARPWY